MDILIMEIENFVKSNWAYLLWFAFYFTLSFLFISLFTATILSAFIIAFLLYAISLTVALSSMGEELLRGMNGLRELKTMDEKDYLRPIFKEVYKNALKATPNLNRKIKLYISDDLNFNAFAIGRETIVLTSGVIKSFSSDQLKGLLAHEFGHMAHGDTKALLLTTIGNGFFTVILWCLNIVIKIFDFILSRKEDMEIVQIFVKGFISICNCLIALVLGIGNLIINLNSRQSEYEADSYAYILGYGEDLKECLVILDKISINGSMTLFERINSTHPHTLDRIAQLENMMLL